jgi:hypothetical protein
VSGASTTSCDCSAPIALSSARRADSLYVRLRHVEPRPRAGLELVLRHARELLEQPHVALAGGNLRVGPLHHHIEPRHAHRHVVLGLLQTPLAGLGRGARGLVVAQRGQVEELHRGRHLRVQDVERPDHRRLAGELETERCQVERFAVALQARLTLREQTGQRLAPRDLGPLALRFRQTRHRSVAEGHGDGVRKREMQRLGPQSRGQNSGHEEKRESFAYVRHLRDLTITSSGWIFR